MCRFCPNDRRGFAVAEPGPGLLEGFKDALRRGWSPNNVRDISREELAEVEQDPVAYLARLSDRALLGVVGQFVELPDGSRIPRLPGAMRWVSDADGFIGQVGLRFQPGTDSLPPNVLGHIGYAVVPWRRGRGFAKRALAHTLVEARRLGLGRVMITCDASNVASRRVIEANGGDLFETFVDERFGPSEKLRYFAPTSGD